MSNFAVVPGYPEITQNIEFVRIARAYRGHAGTILLIDPYFTQMDLDKNIHEIPHRDNNCFFSPRDQTSHFYQMSPEDVLRLDVNRLQANLECSRAEALRFRLLTLLIKCKRV